MVADVWESVATRMKKMEDVMVTMKLTGAWLIVRKYLETLDREVDSIAVSQGLPGLRGALIGCLPPWRPGKRGEK